MFRGSLNGTAATLEWVSTKFVRFGWGGPSLVRLIHARTRLLQTTGSLSVVYSPDFKSVVSVTAVSGPIPDAFSLTGVSGVTMAGSDEETAVRASGAARPGLNQGSCTCVCADVLPVHPARRPGHRNRKLGRSGQQRASALYVWARRGAQSDPPTLV